MSTHRPISRVTLALTLEQQITGQENTMTTLVGFIQRGNGILCNINRKSYTKLAKTLKSHQILSQSHRKLENMAAILAEGTQKPTGQPGTE